jgi:hypothetical protein
VLNLEYAPFVVKMGFGMGTDLRRLPLLRLGLLIQKRYGDSTKRGGVS